MGYEMLDHTADVGLRVWAPDLDSLFAEAGRALVDVMGAASGPEAGEIPVSIEAPDLGALLVDWLSELLYVLEAKAVVPRRLDVHVDAGKASLSGVVAGPDAAGLVQHGAVVKAVTYHGLEIRSEPGRCEATVYLDV